MKDYSLGKGVSKQLSEDNTTILLTEHDKRIPLYQTEV